MNSSLLNALLKVLPRTQAKRELRWIKNELPEEKWEHAVDQRSHLVPLQYILGNTPFGKLAIKCASGVLIPRWETEEWCMEMKKSLGASLSGKNILDYCTGTGCIALSIATDSQMKPANVIGTDISNAALSLAEENKSACQPVLSRLGCNITFERCDLRKLEIPKSADGFDFLVSNPPYIPKDKMSVECGVECSVLKYEPRIALVGNLEFYHYLTALLPKIGARGFIFEVGYKQQAEATRRYLPNTWKCGIRYDSAGTIRNVIGWCDPEFDALNGMVREIL